MGFDIEGTKGDIGLATVQISVGEDDVAVKYVIQLLSCLKSTTPTDVF